MTRIQLRRGTAAQWTSANPVLAAGEPGVETDTHTWKVGDGTTAWASLSYESATATLADGSVVTAKVADGAVTAVKVAADVATQARLDAETTARTNADALLIPLSQRGAASGVATLDAGGKLPSVFLPPLAINDTFTVTSQAAMLALVAQRGDAAVRTDLVPLETFLLATDDPTQLVNWIQITTPGAVTTVDGRTGAVSLTDRYPLLSAGVVAPAQLGSGASATTFLAGDSTYKTVSASGTVADATTTAKGVVQLAGDLAGTAAAPTVPGKVGTARLITTGTGLTGGGDLTLDRTLAVAFGTAVGTALQGNDPSTTNARTPTAHAASHAAGGSDPVTVTVPFATLVRMGSD